MQLKKNDCGNMRMQYYVEEAFHTGTGWVQVFDRYDVKEWFSIYPVKRAS